MKPTWRLPEYSHCPKHFHCWKSEPYDDLPNFHPIFSSSWYWFQFYTVSSSFHLPHSKCPPLFFCIQWLIQPFSYSFDHSPGLDPQSWERGHTVVFSAPTPTLLRISKKNSYHSLNGCHYDFIISDHMNSQWCLPAYTIICTICWIYSPFFTNLFFYSFHLTCIRHIFHWIKTNTAYISDHL